MNFKTEAIFGSITMMSKFLISDIVIDFVIGISVYFASRLLYKNYGSKVDRLFKKLKASAQSFFKIK